MNPPAQALAILGPTASGKTALGLALARHQPIEIISLDSALVYRGMDIGTAKPAVAERQAVIHHLIDIRDPDQTYSAADFATEAQALIQAITARGRVPVLVGGTMMYFKALTEGLDDLPAADASIRLELEQAAALQGWPALHARLAQIDPDTAQRLAPQDSQRIQRALEVHALTGRPMSSFHRRAGQLRCPVRVISLEPADRSLLHQRIADRFAGMLKAGLLDELSALKTRYALHPGLPSMRCVGYRQAWEVLAGDMPSDELVDRGVFATRQLAKRQLTWLRSLPDRQCFDPFSESELEAALRSGLETCGQLLSSRPRD